MEGIANWENLTWQEKREARFKKWLDAPGVSFKSPAAKQAYRQRVTRFIKVIKLEEPDRVPVMLPSGYYPAVYAGYSLKEVMYDYQKLADAWRKFNRDFQPDSYSGPGLVYPGRVLEKIGHKLHKWPGHGLPDDASMYQFVEGVYMQPEEFDDFLENPTEYWEKVFLPRTAGALEAFKYITPFSPVLTNPLGWIMSFSRPDVQKAFETVLEAGKEIAKWRDAVGAVSREALEEGFASLGGGGMAGAPFDNLSDVLRGTQGIVMDMFRRPEKIKEAMERLVPVIVKGAVKGADASLSPVVSMPLHKGENSFMSGKQFEEFYWPTFKKVLLGMINEGLVPMPFAEGNYEPRLDIIKDMPRSSVIWYFEVMDMAKAKQALGGVACIAGNVPASLLVTSTPVIVKEACRKLIETCAKGGGYILTGAASVSKCNPANLHAMMAAAEEYGKY
ncbi:MAG: uroporphyrinogen decarboxylase family protein [Dehalococcoidales bacterium]|jgi:uroporphyrinogen-III decarboxylase